MEKVPVTAREMAYVPPHRRAAAASGGGGRPAQARAAPSDGRAERFSGEARSSTQDARTSLQDLRMRDDGAANGRDGPQRHSSQDARHARDGPPRGGHGNKPRGKGAPSRFGSIGKTMEGALRAGEDIAGGERLDEEGMVYAMADGSLTFFQDRRRQYPFHAGREAVPLLRGLIDANRAVFALARARVDATADPRATAAEGLDTLSARVTSSHPHHLRSRARSSSDSTMVMRYR